jgi:hypothetical protein
MTLDDFFDHLRYSNPFEQDRISDPSEADVDVTTIHDKEYRELVEFAERSKRERRGVGVVLWGEAGIGKSHLLARFSRWAEEDRRACYVFLHNIHVHAERLPRYILKSVVSRLTSGRRHEFRRTRLYGLMYRVMNEAIRRYSDDPQVHRSQYEWLTYFEKLLNDHLRQGRRRRDPDDATIYRVLFEFFVSAMLAAHGRDNEHTAAAAIRWLSGEPLDEAETVRLGLKTEQGQSLAVLQDNRQVERVLIALMELCRLDDQSFIVVFDQVENLDSDEISALSRFCHSLLDHATNLLVVTSGVELELIEYKKQGFIPSSSWDRIAQHEVMLYLISPVQARQLLEARIEKFFESFMTLPEVKERLTTDTLFPLGQEWLAEQIDNAIAVKPRHVISWARKRWRDQANRLREQGGEAWLEEWAEAAPRVEELRSTEQIVDHCVEEKIREQVRRRELDPSALPPDASNLCGLVEALLKQCEGARDDYTLVNVARPQGRTKTAMPAYDLLAQERTPDGRMVATGVTFIVTEAKISIAASLRRMCEDSPPPDHVLVVCDARLPMECAQAGQDYLNRLEQRGPDRFRVVNLTLTQYAELDALEAVLGEARSGDLEVMLPQDGNRRLTPEEVIASHHRQDRYRSHPLLRELLCEEPLPPVAPPEPKLDAAEFREFIRSQLALTMGLSSVELAQKYCARADQGASMPFEAVKARLEEVAQAMHLEELINVSPTSNSLYLLNRPGR